MLYTLGLRTSNVRNTALHSKTKLYSSAVQNVRLIILYVIWKSYVVLSFYVENMCFVFIFRGVSRFVVGLRPRRN